MRQNLEEVQLDEHTTNIGIEDSVLSIMDDQIV